MSAQQTSVRTIAGKESRRMERARRYVQDNWMPVNPNLLGKIQAGLEAGCYDLDIDFLLQELKTDVGLFTYCLRQLGKLLRQSGVSVPDSENPFELFRRAGLDRIKSVLAISGGQVSTHSLCESEELQFRQLKELIVSASTVEVLAEGVDIDPALGYSTALLRQFGLALIAWNYPTTHKRALRALKDGTSLDESFANLLGSTPAMLAISVMQEWGLGQQMIDALDSEDTCPDDTSPQDNETILLKKICQIGEALARAEHPDLYPGAGNDFEAAKELIRDYLGDQGMQLIKQRIRENCEHYAAFLPNHFPDMDFDPDKQVGQHREEQSTERNPHLRALPVEVLQKFKRVYTQLTDSIDPILINYIVKTVIPAAGFSGGCIYLADPATKKLIPRTKIGRLQRSTPSTVNYNGIAYTDCPIRSAFKCRTPIRGDEYYSSDGVVSYISASIGGARKAGVLYLEMTHACGHGNTQDRTIQSFKAVLKTLEDAFQLGE